MNMNEELQRIAEMERDNLALSRESLGGGMELLEDFQETYRTLGEIVLQEPTLDATERGRAIHVSTYLLLRCQCQFLQGALKLLRGYRGDSLITLRTAIEACAFAIRMLTHNHMADCWLNAAESKQAYKKFRDKFEKMAQMYPPTDPILTELYRAYDISSKTMHASVLSMASHFGRGDQAGEYTIRYRYCDLPSTKEMLAVFYSLLKNHLLIVRRFSNEFNARGCIKADALQVWEVRYNGLDAKLSVYREKWKAEAAWKAHDGGGAGERVGGGQAKRTG